MRTLARRGRVVGALSAALLAGVVAAWATTPRDALPTGTSSASTSSASTSSSTPSASTPSASTRMASPPSAAAATPPPPAQPAAHPATPTASAAVPAPTELVIPRLRLAMPVEPVAVAPDGQMALPATPDVAGWYRWGPAPGSRAGASVIAGHVDTAADGVGPFAGLAGLRSGDLIEVSAGALTHRYRVTSVTSVHKTSLDLAALFDRSGPARLHLVTCGGRYDRVARHYEDNVVVVATPVDDP